MFVARTVIFSSVVAATLCAALVGRAEPPAAALLELHTKEAEGYLIYRDEAHESALELRAKPIFSWTNLVGEHPQRGHLFVWTAAGRPEAIGTMFSTRATDLPKRMVVHEFHTLSSERLFPVCPESNAFQWKPERGIVLAACDEAPLVAEMAPQRLTQMRGLARTFAAESQSRAGQKWKLRLLPTPLWQYEAAAAGILHGALFAMVSSAGTDPEVLLVIEARHSAGDEQGWAWHAAALRFSDQELTVTRRERPLWSSLDDDQHRAEIKHSYTLIETPDKAYSCYRARFIDELPDEPQP